jgi:hypothetical protein
MEVVQPSNTFAEDKFFWVDLCEHLDNTLWDRDNVELLEYLRINLPRVLAMCGADIVIKRSESVFFDIRAAGRMGNQLIHYKASDIHKASYITLATFINVHKRLFPQFSELSSYYDESVRVPDPRIFVCCRKPVATSR